MSDTFEYMLRNGAEDGWLPQAVTLDRWGLDRAVGAAVIDLARCLHDPITVKWEEHPPGAPGRRGLCLYHRGHAVRAWFQVPG